MVVTPISSCCSTLSRVLRQSLRVTGLSNTNVERRQNSKQRDFYMPKTKTPGTFTSGVYDLTQPLIYNPSFVTAEGGLANTEAALMRDSKAERPTLTSIL